VVIAYQLVGAVTRRFPGDERFALVAAVIIVSVMTVVAAVLVGDNWSIGAEVLRVGNGHLSDRTERLPWRQYRPAIIAMALGVFWLVAVVRIKAERAQAAERRNMFGADDELYLNR
jgi:ABC-type Fe3+ transport system permease subunit